MLGLAREAEGLLWSYPINALRLNDAESQLAELRNLLDCRGQTYDHIPAKSGTHSDPVAGLFERIEPIERIVAKLRDNVAVVADLRDTLKHSQDSKDVDMYNLMELFYFEHKGFSEVASLLGKSVRTLSRVRQSLIASVIKRM